MSNSFDNKIKALARDGKNVAVYYYENSLLSDIPVGGYRVVFITEKALWPCVRMMKRPADWFVTAGFHNLGRVISHNGYVLFLISPVNFHLVDILCSSWNMVMDGVMGVWHRTEFSTDVLKEIKRDTRLDENERAVKVAEYQKGEKFTKRWTRYGYTGIQFVVLLRRPHAKPLKISAGARSGIDFPEMAFSYRASTRVYLRMKAHLEQMIGPVRQDLLVHLWKDDGFLWMDDARRATNTTVYFTLHQNERALQGRLAIDDFKYGRASIIPGQCSGLGLTAIWPRNSKVRLRNGNVRRIFDRRRGKKYR